MGLLQRFLFGLLLSSGVIGGLTAFNVLNEDKEWDAPPHNLNVVCYVATWANYRVSPVDYNIGNIDPTQCTHLVYSFAGLDNATHTIMSLDEWTDLDPEEGGRGFFRQMTGLRVEHPHLKVILAIGGYNEGSDKYSTMASTYENRRVFIDSVMEMLLKYEFDGLDMDWEYPTLRGGNPEDRDDFTALARELREAFDPFGLLLTGAFSANVDTIANAYDFPVIQNYFHLMNIMAYDYHGSWDNVTGSNAPLYNQPDQFSVMDTLSFLVELGVPLNKVTLGLPLYGHTFLLDDPNASDAHELGAPCGFTGFAGEYTKADGFMGYHEICLLRGDPNWQYFFDEATGTPYLVNYEKVVSYDDENSITMKVDYAVRLGVGGLMVWSTDTDDFRGNCGGGYTYPLMKRINNAVVDILADVERKKSL